MVDGNKLGDVGFKYLGASYDTMDCQKFVEVCLSDCGLNIDLAGSNTWYREVAKNGRVLTPEECVNELGRVPKGAFLFIVENDGKEPAHFRNDGMGNASHIGLCTGSRGKGAIHSSSKKHCVAESVFREETIKNGGWNMVGLWNKVAYDYGYDKPSTTTTEPATSGSPVLKRGFKGTEVAYLQALLMCLDYDLGSYGADGDFGKKTEEAVKKFQKANGLEVDGIVGPKTWAALEQAVPSLPNTETETEDNGELYGIVIMNLTKDEVNELQAKYPDSYLTNG